MTGRRSFIGSLALATLVSSGVASAQPARKRYRIGIFGLRATSDLVGPEPRSPSTKAFLRGMRELGSVYGEHFVTEARGSEGKLERLPGLAAELVALQVDVIVAAGPTLQVLKQATSTIPIVMASGGDPVAEGYAQSLAHPGRNFTGLSGLYQQLSGKRIELLKELAPGMAPVAVLWDQPGGIAYWDASEAAARVRGWKLLSIGVRDAGDLESAFNAATDGRAGSLLVNADGTLFPHARRVAELAARSRLPAMYGQRSYVEAGGLISYGADIDNIWRQAAAYVDKILRGAKPAEIPIEQPTKFELVINIKAAKAQGLKIPQSLLLRADEVIE